MSTVETVIWSYLLAGLIYGVYYCYYDRKRLGIPASLHPRRRRDHPGLRCARRPLAA